MSDESGGVRITFKSGRLYLTPFSDAPDGTFQSVVMERACYNMLDLFETELRSHILRSDPKPPTLRVIRSDHRRD